MSDVRLKLERPGGGALVVSICVSPANVSFVGFARVDEKGVRLAGFGVQAEELDSLERAIRECRRLLLGHPRHDVKSLDPVLKGTS